MPQVSRDLWLEDMQMCTWSSVVTLAEEKPS